MSFYLFLTDSSKLLMKILNNYGARPFMFWNLQFHLFWKKTFDFLDTLATEPLYLLIYTFFPTLISSTCLLLLRPVLTQFLFQ